MFFSGVLCKVVGLDCLGFFADDSFSMNKILKTHVFSGLVAKFKLTQFISGLLALDGEEIHVPCFEYPKSFPSETDEQESNPKRHLLCWRGY